MSKTEYEFYGVTVYVQRGRGKEWEGWIKGEDHTTFITESKRDCLDELRSEAYFQTHQHLKKV